MIINFQYYYSYTLMSSDADDSSPRQRRKVRIIELLRQRPRNEVSGCLVPSAKLALHTLLGDPALKRHLNHAEYVWETRSCSSALHGSWPKQDVQAVRGGVRQHLQVVWRVLVVCCRVQRPDSLQQGLCQWVVGEQCVSVQQEQLTVFRRRKHTHDAKRVGDHIQTQETVQPRFDVVPCGVSYGGF